MASQNRSLFAAKCFVETMVEMYRRGYTLDDIKLSVMLATLATADPLKPIALDILLAWSSIVMMTLRTVGVPLLPEGEARRARKGRDGSGDAADEEDKDRMTQGLENFAKQCLEKYQDGTDLFRLQLQQSMAGERAGAFNTLSMSFSLASKAAAPPNLHHLLKLK